MTRLNRDALVNDDPMCKHGRLLHQDCMACEDIAAALARDSTTAALIDSLSLQVGEQRAEIAEKNKTLDDLIKVRKAGFQVRGEFRATIRERDAEIAGLVHDNARLMEAASEAATEVTRLRAALSDMLSGWRYIRTHHGDLSGVGWGRCEDAASAALEPPA